MKINRISIHNYKSLKHVEFTPGAFSVLVGANASGKSNFASALDFLSDVYSVGLEIALARKGGFDNIAYRKIRRSKSPIAFQIETEFAGRDATRLLMRFLSRTPKERASNYSSIRLTHQFSFQTSGQGIGAEYRIIEENIRLEGAQSSDKAESVIYTPLVVVSRTQKGVELLYVDKGDIGQAIREYVDVVEKFELGGGDAVGQSERLIISSLFGYISRILGQIAVYQFSPTICRSPGVPANEPKLSAYGENLPAIVDWIKKKHPPVWIKIMDSMRDVLPGLNEISVQYLHTKTLGLFFEEEAVGRHWNAEDVSDGTIQALAILVALFDPRSSALLIEEPENSIHPWIVKLVVDHLKKLSSRKQVIVTTHSPELINLVHPEQVWLVYRESGETQLKPLREMDPDVERDWLEGRYRLYEYLSSGAIPYAVPGR